MKYVIDLDSLKDCLEFLRVGVMNGQTVAPIADVKRLIDKFPKDKLDHWGNTRDYIKPENLNTEFENPLNISPT